MIKICNKQCLYGSESVLKDRLCVVLLSPLSRCTNIKQRGCDISFCLKVWGGKQVDKTNSQYHRRLGYNKIAVLQIAIGLNFLFKRKGLGVA